MEQGTQGVATVYRLFVGNMGSRMTEEELRAMVEAFGTVKSIRVVRDDVTGSSGGYAFVEMADGAALAVAKLNGRENAHGHSLIVRALF